MMPSYPPPPSATHYPPMMNYQTKTDMNVLPPAPVQMPYPNGAHGGIWSRDFLFDTNPFLETENQMIK